MFELNGQNFSLEQLQTHALNNNLEFDEYMRIMQNAGMKEKKSNDFNEFDVVYFGENIDREIVNIGSRGINTFLKAIKGVGEYGQALEKTASDWYGSYTNENEEQKQKRLEKLKIHQDKSILMRSATPIIETLERGEIKADKGITQQFEAGNYKAATRQIISGGIESIPSLLAAYSGYGGLTALAVSVAGNKFDEEFEKNPEESSGKLLLNATGSGVIEAGFELVTRGLMKKAGILKNNGNIDQAKKIIDEGSTALAISMGVGGEALSESSTQVASLLYDQDRKSVV